MTQESPSTALLIHRKSSTRPCSSVGVCRHCIVNVLQAHGHPQRHGSAKLQAARQAAATAREKNRAAQRRYRSRKKVWMIHARGCVDVIA